MILLFWGVSGVTPPPPKKQTGTGGPPPRKHRRFVYDVFRSGRVVRRPATQRAIEAPAPKSAVRVVVEGQPSEIKARAIAKVVARTRRSIDAQHSVEEQIVIAVLLEIGELDV